MLLSLKKAHPHPHKKQPQNKQKEIIAMNNQQTGATSLALRSP